MMTVEEAEAIILREGFASDNTPADAMSLMVRMGEEPSKEQMSRLLTAIKTLFKAQVGQATMDRRLAAALWTLGDVVFGNMQSWESNGRQWRQEFQYGVVNLHTAIESFFYDIWAVDDREA